ncbi:MAG: methyltransferase [Gammaproteobacteria bacterium]|nr:methyltransferase [Gammaproteobacteria bacterium]
MQKDREGDNRLAGFVQPESTVPDDTEAGDAEEYITLWQELYEQTYSDKADNEETLNTVGWVSSYTGQAIPAEEMREWADQAVVRILALNPKKILEIGCGTGMLLGKVAPHCEEYTGTDFSGKALDFVREMQKKLGGLENVQLFERWADDFSGLPEKHFDLIVINSVIQHFPNMDYLLKVLQGMLGVLAPGGKIFLGDISNFAALETFHASVRSCRADSSMNAGQLRRAIHQAMEDERDLLIAPAFFNAVRRRFPAIIHAQAEPKHGQFHNQLTRFRYEVLLHTESALSVRRDLEWADWEDGMTLEAVRNRLSQQQPAAWALRNIPNARLHTEMHTLRWLEQAAPDASVAQLREFAARPNIGLEPDAVWNLARDLPCRVEISWLNTGLEGRFDAVFTHTDQDWQPAEFQPMPAPQPWSAYANNRARQTTIRLKRDVREYLLEKLPEYMIPSSFVVLDRFPLTPNGKIDRNALARLDVSDAEEPGESIAAYTPPGDALERLLADFWAETLDIPQVGIHDNFFRAGGNSLKGMELLNKLQKRLSHSFPVTVLFDNSTVAGFAVYLRSRYPALAASINIIDKERESGEI